MKAVAVLLACSLALAACNNNSTNPTTQQAQTAPPKQELTQQQRERIITTTTRGLEAERDKVERITFYTPPTSLDEWNTQSLAAYISLPDGRGPILRINPHYHGEDWIFFNHIKVMADNDIVYDKQFSFGDVKRDNNSAGVYESADYAARDDDIAAMRKIATAKSVTVRLSGREHRQDFDMSPEDQARIAKSLSTYDALQSFSP